MNRPHMILIALFIFALACTTPDPATETDGRTAPLFNDLGDYHHTISTDVAMAQRYFDQGLTLAYAFNHAEAERSFREAARLDPDCAMCHWGAALVLGPNINAVMDRENVPKAWAAVQQAVELSANASEKEKAFIQALAKRYAENPPDDRSSLDQAYAEAMRGVAKQYPDDPDAATLLAEALMDLHPWDYWQKSGEPQPWITEIVTLIEATIQRAPKHPGAHHLYIHAVEASPNPGRATASADLLGSLAPGAGHLVHMPSHIYIRTGRYRDGSLVNQRAIEADQSYITQCRAQGLYPLAYMPHNHHFLWATATMEGRSEVAIQAARETAKVDHSKMHDAGLGTLQHFYTMPYYALTRFGKWDEILQEAAPGADLKYPTGVWHYARGLAFNATGQPNVAAQELEKLKLLAQDPEIEKVTVWDINSAKQLLAIAVEVLSGELAAKQKDYRKAISHLEQAVALEHELKYNEPPDWYYPARQSLGAVLLEANRAAEAEQVYRRDLEINPENGWSLFGLAASLHAQNKADEALAANQRFEKAWVRADVKLSSSRF